MSTNELKSENSQYFSILNEFDRNKTKLKNMFEHPDVKDGTIVALSINGMKRKGKTFFMNNCLNFLYDHFPSINIVDNPLQNSSRRFEENLLGFPSGHNNQATNDVLIWNDVFLYTNDRTREKLAIVVMDVQISSDQAGNTNIFEFLTAISSIQIINLYGEIDYYQLEFMKTVLNSNNAGNELKSLQSLVFLVRDWSNLDEFSYGIEEGDKYLTKLSENSRDASLKLTLMLLRASFENFNCILLPHPGSAFVNKGNYDEMDEEFKDEIIAAIKYLFKPENLVSKKLNNVQFKGAYFVDYIQQQGLRYRKAIMPNQVNCDTTSKAEHRVTIQVSSSLVELSPQQNSQAGLLDAGPLQVLKFSEDNKILTEYSELKQLLEHAELLDRKIVALSTVGVYRKGKSFFLNYCLRYLYAHYPSLNHPNMSPLNPDDWMGDEEKPLEGFSWRSGSVRDTSGILVWNDAFLSTNSNDEKIAIIVIDTQGLFESGTDPEDDSRIFTLGTLMSSILVLNLFDVVQENQLEYLQFAIESAKFAVDKKPEIDEKPFQHLVFLIRDWGNQDDHSCGLDGGNEYLKYFLKSKSDKREEFKSICEVITESFEQINCSLLPHPGNTVAVGKTKNKKYNGNWVDMDEDFKDELKEVIEFILNTTKLIPRKVNGVTLNGPDYLTYIQKCFTHFQSDRIPQVKTICDSIVDKDLNKLINSCFNSYKDVVRSKLKDIKNLNDLQNLHEDAKNVGLDLYKKSNKMGDSEHEEKYQKELEDKMSTYMKEISMKEEKNFKEIEEEAKKLRLIYEQKEKDQVSKYGSVSRPVERQPKHTDPSASGRLVEIKSRPTDNDTLGIHKHQAQPPQQHHVQHPQTHNTRLDPITDKELNTLVESCIHQYKNMMFSNKSVITNEDNFAIYHGMNKSGAILKFEDSKSVGNPKYVNQYKEILNNEIEEIFKFVKIQFQKGLQEEMERNRALEAEEARRIKDEQIRQDENYARELAKQEKLRLERESNAVNKNNEEKIQALEVKLRMAENARIEAERGRYLAEEFANRKKRESGFFKKIFLMVFGSDHHRH